MASLTHVCIWSGTGWKKITAAEAGRIHPGGTVSARSGLFMCELCGQYVTLIDGQYQVRHFRHSSSEKSKNCPDRVEGQGYHYAFIAGEHELPLRIIVSNTSQFFFEIGFIRVPKSLLSTKSKIIIHSDRTNKKYEYLRERIRADQISYLPVGDDPVKKYRLVVSDADTGIYQYWPKEISGVDPEGTLFDKSNGRKLVVDSDVLVNRPYYLLKRGRLSANSRHITIREITKKSEASWLYWTLYEIQAKDYDEYTAKFFLDLHYRLTEDPVNIHYIWPIHIESPYIVKHNRSKLMAFVSGYANTQVFPKADLHRYECSRGSVIEIECSGRQQMITAGRMQPLQYTYYWKEPLTAVSKVPSFSVNDTEGKEITSGIYNELPKKQIICVNIPYDGYVVVERNGVLIEKQRIEADNTRDVEVAWENEIRVYIGTDCIWKASFLRPVLIQNDIDDAFVDRITQIKGSVIKCPHGLKYILSQVKNQKLRVWIYDCLKSGYIREKAYRELQKAIIDRNKY